MAAPSRELSPFTVKVFAVLRRIPRGRVATYKQVAALAGSEPASRGVAWILNSCARARDLPWQRAISSAGRIAFRPGSRGFLLQRRPLREEGVVVEGPDGLIDLKRHQYRRWPRAKRRGRLEPRMFGHAP